MSSRVDAVSSRVQTAVQMRNVRKIDELIEWKGKGCTKMMDGHWINVLIDWCITLL